MPEPYLAESVETADDQTYTITLHEGVMFHDGTPLDAEAVKVNLERHMDPANQVARARQRRATSSRSRSSTR